MATADSECGCLLEEPSQLEEAKEMALTVREAGLPIMDRSAGLFSVFGFGKYPNCFISSELVDLLIQLERAKNRQEAVKIGQLLMDTDLIHHVSDKQQFDDGKEFYIFREDEGESKGPSAASIRQIKGAKCGYALKKGWVFWSRYYLALSCPNAKQLFIYRQDLDSAPVFDYSFSEATIQPDVSRNSQKLIIDLTLTIGKPVLFTVAFETEDELFAWTTSFGKAGAKVLETVGAAGPNVADANSVFEFTAIDIEGEEYKLEEARGNVLLIVNVASS